MVDLTEAKIIDLNRIVADPDQPRRTFDIDRLEELADSIRVEGVLQPIVVRFEPSEDHYVVVHGERRWRASQLAGLASIPAIVRDVPVERRLVQQLMENVVRDDLNAVDRAAALRALRIQLENPPWEDVAAAVGIKRSRLFQLLGTEKLAPAVQDDIRSGVLSEKQSRLLQGLPPDRQAALHSYLLTTSRAMSEASRLARAFREAEALDNESAEQTLERIQAFVFAVDGEQLHRQSRALLRAIRDSRAGTSRGHQRLTSLNAVLNPGKHRDERIAQDINRLAKSLAALATSNDSTPEMDPDLRELRDTLDTLLN
ncbi:MAG TPA: ParB/RepB/Spo0J family partition protein [Thermomicrobiales bacterium]|nr:ParB/RepB/Spo0J family partition protein [Thermomicrobiales bacterium]